MILGGRHPLEGVTRGRPPPPLAMTLSIVTQIAPVSVRSYRASVFPLDWLSYFSVKRINSFIQATDFVEI